MNSAVVIFVAAVVALASAGNLGLVRTVGVAPVLPVVAAPVAYSHVYSHAAPAVLKTHTYAAPAVYAAPAPAIIKTHAYASPVVYAAPAPAVIKTHHTYAAPVVATGPAYAAGPILL